MRRDRTNKSVVHESIATAKKAVLAAFAVSALIISTLIGERILFESRIIQAADATRRATALNGDILLADERLTMSANMAAATGEAAWVERYEENIPVIDRAISDAKGLAEPEVARRFDAETRVANDLLVAMERRTFDLERLGRLAEARAILDSPYYARQKQILADGSDRFSNALLAHADNRLNAVRTRALWMTVGLLLMAAIGFVLLWRNLSRSLGRSRQAYLAAEQQIQKLAMHDPLTELPNRHHFNDELKVILETCRAANRKAAIIMLDLDRFKMVNDRFGHGVGDGVLSKVGRLLRGALLRGEICARLGGDEFVVAVPFESGGERPYPAAERFVVALAAPVEVEGSMHQIGASGGVAVFPDHGSQADELIRKADVALYRAKREQRGGVRVFEEAMDEEIRYRAQNEADLRQAIGAGEIVPFFQPVVNLATGDIESFEALARWQHPQKGILGPASFIDAAEDFGLIDELSLSILRQACEAARSWPRQIGVAVNITPAQLGRRSFAERIISILAETGLPATALEIEVTETALLANVERATEVVWFLKNAGVRLALDDFGTGYSSLHHLRLLPFDRIKIDGSFVKAMAGDHDAAAIVNAIISLARSLDLPTVAEWVEDAATASALKSAGCVAGQGWYFGKPMSALNAWRLLNAGPEEQSWRAVA